MGAEPDQAAIDKGINVAMPPVLDYLERTIPASGFLVEDRFTLADIAVASPFVNLEHAGFDFAKWPKAKAYAGRHPGAAVVRGHHQARAPDAGGLRRRLGRRDGIAYIPSMPLDALLEDIAACRACAPYLPHTPRPVTRVSTATRILIAGQAPGRIGP